MTRAHCPAAARTGTSAAHFFVALSICAAILNSTTPSTLYAVYQARWHFGATTLAAIFAIYSVGTLAALLILGRLSDRLPDRRLVIVPALLVCAAGATMFALADSVFHLFAGRLLAGVGTGAVVGAANAAMVELDPRQDRVRAAVMASVAFTAGASLGPIISAVALQLGWWPTQLPFALLACLSLVTALALVALPWPIVARVPATSVANWPERSGGVLPTLRLIRVPFFAAAIALILSWSIGSTFMALGPTFTARLFDLNHPAVGAFTLAGFQLVAGTVQFICRQRDPAKCMIRGSVLVVAALLACTLGAWVGLPLLFICGVLVVGVGYGAAFVGAAGTVNLVAPPDQRATIVSLFYVAGYFGNTIPLVALGAVADAIGLLGGLVFLAAAAIALVLLLLALARRLQ